VEYARHIEVLHFQQWIADLGFLFREEIADVPTDHAPHDLRHIGVGGSIGGDVGAVAHHGDGVAEVEDFIEPMRDEHQSPALIA
jgi:hypothetical protein